MMPRHSRSVACPECGRVFSRYRAVEPFCQPRCLARFARFCERLGVRMVAETTSPVNRED